MQHIFTRKVISRRDFGGAGLFFMPLLLYNLVALNPELDSGKRMDHIVDTGMAGLPASQERAVGGVDDGIAAQCRNIPLPERDPGIEF